MQAFGPGPTDWEWVLIYAAFASPLWVGLLAGGLAALFLHPLRIVNGALLGLGMGILVYITAFVLTNLVWNYGIPLPYTGFNWVFVPTPLSVMGRVKVGPVGGYIADKMAVANWTVRRHP